MALAILGHGTMVGTFTCCNKGAERGGPLY